MVLHEIPGALERPADCGIAIRRDGGVTTIDIPPSRLSRPLLLAGAFYGVLLLLFMVTGIVLYTTGKAILILHWIAIDDAHPNFSPPFRRFIPWSIPVWAALTWIGGHVLLSILRPALQHEQIKIEKTDVIYRRRFLLTKFSRHFAGENVRGFFLRKDDAGMRPEAITIVGRGESVEIGEFLRPAEREWLVSAGNALLRAL